MVDFYVACVIGIIGLALVLYVIFGDDVTYEKKAVSDMTYSEFSLYILEQGLEPVMDACEFEIYYINDTYYYYECHPRSYNNVFYELENIAVLDVSDEDALLFPDIDILSTLIECDVCGGSVTDDCIYYAWFKKKVK